MPKCLWINEVGLTAVASTFSHTYEYRTYRYSVSFPPPLCVFISCALTLAYQPRSTGHDLSLRQQREREQERERGHGMGEMAVLFCWCRNFQSRPSWPKGFKFLLLNTSAVFTKSLKQMPRAHQLPLAQPGVGFKRASCAKAKQKPSDFSVISPRRWSNGLAHAGRWWLWWCQSKRAQSGFGGVQSGGVVGGWGWRE